MSKFFKGFGIGVAVAAVVGIAGAGYLAVKKIKESDKRVDELIKDLIKRKNKEEKECLCENCDGECECTHEEVVELQEVEPIVVEEEAVQLEIEDFVPLMEKDLNEVTQDDYLEAVIEQRDALQAEVDEAKETKKAPKRKRLFK